MTVGVYVDVETLLLSAMEMGHRAGMTKPRVDLEHLLAKVGAGREVKIAHLYAVTVAGQPDNFAARMRKTGFKVHFKPKTPDEGLAVWMSDIVVQMVRDASQWDACVLCSGSGGFIGAVECLKREGKRVEVATFPDSASVDLVAMADRVWWLGQRDVYSGAVHGSA